MTRVLLLSTFELGAQPLGCAAPAALLAGAGHEIRQHDLSIEPWPTKDAAWAEAVACSVPMHTALRLALQALEHLRAERPGLPVAFHGLYAPVAMTAGALGERDLATAGDVEEALLAWASRSDPAHKESGQIQVSDPSRPGGPAGPAVSIELGPVKPFDSKGWRLPDRSSLPGLDRYARLLVGEEQRLVGAVESSQGCNHTCRHCPVPVVYRGRSRPLPEELVAGDIDQLVAAGAEHIHFGDPDFLNRPRHALSVARRLHEQHPEVSFDATIKVSHILRHAELFADLAAYGLSFVTSAFESTSDKVLDKLDKGHDRAGAARAIAILRSVGIEIRPSLLPFTPWTVREDLVELFDFVARNDLIWNVDPVQYGVRLLIPPGSLLLELEDEVLARAVTGYDRDELGYAWRSADPLLDTLQQEIAARTELAAAIEEDLEATYRALRALVHDRLGLLDSATTGPSDPTGAGRLRPRLSESWFCCSEPTSAQRAVIGAPCSAGDGC